MVDKSPQIAGNPSALPEAPAGNRALEDYQPQLMLLEQQNKNPLSKARQQPANIDRMSQSELKALRDYQMQILLLEDHKTRQAAALGDQVDGHTNARNPPPFADDKEDSQNAPKASLRSLMRCSDQGSYYLPSGSEEEWDRLASDAALPQSMGNLKLDNSESSNIGGSPQGIKGCGSQLSLDRPSPVGPTCQT